MAGPERRAEATDIPCRLNGNGSVFQLSYTTRRNLRNYHDTWSRTWAGETCSFKGCSEMALI